MKTAIKNYLMFKWDMLIEYKDINFAITILSQEMTYYTDQWEAEVVQLCIICLNMSSTSKKFSSY